MSNASDIYLGEGLCQGQGRFKLLRLETFSWIRNVTKLFSYISSIKYPNKTILLKAVDLFFNVLVSNNRNRGRGGVRLAKNELLFHYLTDKFVDNRIHLTKDYFSFGKNYVLFSNENDITIATYNFVCFPSDQLPTYIRYGFSYCKKRLHARCTFYAIW